MFRKTYIPIVVIIIIAFLTVGSAQAEDEPFDIWPLFVQPPDGSVNIVVPLGDSVVLKTRWGACTRGLAQSWTEQNEITLSINGESMFFPRDESGQYWGNPQPRDIGSQYPCVNGSDTIWWVHWEFELGVLEEGSYQVSYGETVDHLFLDGGDYDGDGEPDLFEWQRPVDFNIIVTEVGSISGTVYEEGNGPIAGIHVDACSWDDDFCNGAETNELGEYTIDGLPIDRNYRVFVWSQPGWASKIYQDTVWFDEATPVPVGSEGIDFALLPGGSISGTVHDAVTGLPVPFVLVDIEDGGYGVCTDENGEYTIAGLPYGTYDIVVGRDFCEPHPYIQQHIFGITINSTTPDVGGYDFYLEIGGSISGNVSDANGPATDVWVDACTLDESYCNGTGTDENGDYTIHGLPAGDYRVSVWGGQGGWLDEFYNDKHMYENADPVPVTIGGDTGGIDFFMDPAGSISGNVLQEGGGGIGGIDVSACIFTNDEICWWTQSEADGSYMIQSLPSGEYRVHAYQHPREFWSEEYYPNTQYWSAADPVSVTPGFDTSSIDFGLVYGGIITGHVGDANGDIENVWVGSCSWDETICWHVMTDEFGNYAIFGRPPGDYRVWVGGGQGPWLEQYYDGKLTFDEADPVTVNPGDYTSGIDFNMVHDSTISGTVTAVGGSPIVERIDVAACRVEDTGVCWWTTIQSDGNYTITGMPDGEFIINVYEVPGGHWIGETYSSTVSLGVDEDVGGINFTLEPEI